MNGCREHRPAGLVQRRGLLEATRRALAAGREVLADDEVPARVARGDHGIVPCFHPHAARVFWPLGEGVVDLEALTEALGEQGFEGWGTVEQDRLPGESASTAREAAAGLRHLRAVGLAA